MSVVAVIPAAGHGSRLGGGTAKQLLPLAGAPLLAWTLGTFEAASVIDEIIVVVPPDGELRFRREVFDRYGGPKLREVVHGGHTRQESVWRGLEAAHRASVIVVHDAARPFASEDLVTRVVRTAIDVGAALAAVSVVDTMKRATADRFVTETLDRDGLWAAQTPQAFRAPLLREAVQRARDAGHVGTDDASVVERLGVSVALVAGEWSNFKITTADDLSRAELLVASGLIRIAPPVPRMRNQTGVRRT